MSDRLSRQHALKLLRGMPGEQADFRPGQWEAIQSLLTGHHTLTVMCRVRGNRSFFNSPR